MFCHQQISLLDYWFPSDQHQPFWFDCTKDNEIYNLFNKQLNDSENVSVENMLKFDNPTKFHYVILLDQITRNISRITKNDTIIEQNDIKALELAKYLCNTNFDLLLPLHCRIFLLLPFRHTNKIDNLNFVIDKLNEYHPLLKESEKSLYQRFYIASLKSYTYCNDNINNKIMHSNKIVYNGLLHDIVCENYVTKPVANVVVATGFATKTLYQSILTFCKKHNITRLGVSLSGGVDSMVLLYLLQQMVLNKKLEKVVAIHIDYHWKEESTLEAQYLFDFCSEISVECVIRNIQHYNNEIDTKIDIKREFVEDETKKIRFNTYKYAMEKYDLSGICLGHHKDDLIENVFMNLSKGKNILDLFVTSEYSVQNNVNILRPMLNHHKKDIIDTAELYNIIYFKDTTPEWSFRGTMRNSIFPSLQKFDTMILGNLYKIGQQSNDWGKFISESIMNPILQTTLIYKHGMSIDFNIDLKNTPTSFWSELFVNLFHTRGIKMISQSNLTYFTQNINNNVLFRFSNGFMVYKNKKSDSGVQLYFINTLFYESLRSQLDSQSVQTLKNNLWEITILPVNDVGDISDKKVSLKHILSGEYTYNTSVESLNDISIGISKNRYDTCFENIMELNHIVPKITCLKKTKTPSDKYINVVVNVKFF